MFWYPKGEDYDIRDSHGVTLRDFLNGYDPGKYERPAVTVDILVFQKTDECLKVLLIRRGRHPSYGKLALPGGFVEMDETLEKAAARELFEETALTDVKLTQLGAYGNPGRDPRMRIISVAYMAFIPKGMEPSAGDDAADAGFYTVRLQKKMNILETIYEFSFENGDCKVRSIVAEKGGKREIIEGGIASDHALMILDALERVGFLENM